MANGPAKLSTKSPPDQRLSSGIFYVRNLAARNPAVLTDVFDPAQPATASFSVRCSNRWRCHGRRMLRAHIAPRACFADEMVFANFELAHVSILRTCRARYSRICCSLNFPFFPPSSILFPALHYPGAKLRLRDDDDDDDEEFLLAKA